MPSKFWFDKPRIRYVADIPENSGDLTPEKCPECGGHVVYNGNYFCEFWGMTHPARDDQPSFRSGGDCDWALPHPAVRPMDRELAMRLCGDTE